MKNALAELSKLRKERHELKTDPIAALGLKVGGAGGASFGQDSAKKLERMKNTLSEIEQVREAHPSIYDLSTLDAQQLAHSMVNAVAVADVSALCGSQVSDDNIFH